MTDTSPAALDALMKRLHDADAESPQRIMGSRIFAEAADTIRALRAAPVAMRERAARVAWESEDVYGARGMYGMAKCARNIAAAIRALPLDAPAPVGPQDGGRPLPTDRDTLGRLVREAWVRWAQTQPNPKASWLAPYDDLDETDKEADRQIGEAIARWTLIHDAARFALDAPAPTEPHKSVLDGNDAPAPVDPVAEAARIDAKDLYYLRAILRRLREFDAAIEEAIGDGADNISLLGNQAMADEIDWLDCKIDWLTRALAQEARHEG